jgi:hypothetical protein
MAVRHWSLTTLPLSSICISAAVQCFIPRCILKSDPRCKAGHHYFSAPARLTGILHIDLADRTLHLTQPDTMANNRYVAFALVLGISAGLCFLLHRWRYGNFTHIRDPFPRSLLLGHLGIISAAMKKLGNPSLHPGGSVSSCHEFSDLTVHKTTCLRASGRTRDVQITCSSTRDPQAILWCS